MIEKTLSRFKTLTQILKHRRHFGAFMQEQERDPHAAQRTLGIWYGPDVERYTDMAKAVAGDIAEIGCYKGATFLKLAHAAQRQGKKAHAFDSFEGMADPGQHDWRPKGQFDVGGPAGFQALMSQGGLQPHQYGLWAGFIPECFVRVPVDLRFSFVLLDVDNYEPTRDSLAWIWPRMNCNGILALDDFYPRHDGEASLAIKEFLRQADDYHIVDCVNAQLVLRKTV